MSIIGTLIDKQTHSRAGDAGTTSHRVGLTTLAHSLPATQAQDAWASLRSMQAGAAAQARSVTPFILGSNASLLTLGYVFNPGTSGLSAPTMTYDVTALVYHTLIQ